MRIIRINSLPSECEHILFLYGLEGRFWTLWLPVKACSLDKAHVQKVYKVNPFSLFWNDRFHSFIFCDFIMYCYHMPWEQVKPVELILIWWCFVEKSCLSRLIRVGQDSLLNSLNLGLVHISSKLVLHFLLLCKPSKNIANWGESSAKIIYFQVCKTRNDRSVSIISSQRRSGWSVLLSCSLTLGFFMSKNINKSKFNEKTIFSPPSCFLLQPDFGLFEVQEVHTFHALTFRQERPATTRRSGGRLK